MVTKSILFNTFLKKIMNILSKKYLINLLFIQYELSLWFEIYIYGIQLRAVLI